MRDVVSRVPRHRGHGDHMRERGGPSAAAAVLSYAITRMAYESRQFLDSTFLSSSSRYTRVCSVTFTEAVQKPSRGSIGCVIG